MKDKLNKTGKAKDDFVIDDSLCIDCEHKDTCDEENKKGCFGYLSSLKAISAAFGEVVKGFEEVARLVIESVKEGINAEGSLADYIKKVGIETFIKNNDFGEWIEGRFDNDATIVWEAVFGSAPDDSWDDASWQAFEDEAIARFTIPEQLIEAINSELSNINPYYSNVANWSSDDGVTYIDPRSGEEKTFSDGI
ncbi:MAG: hypothetical protein LBV04_01775 [Deferribacteraceae bacterium]|jgi:hypothetical protein|nr:hypothetical protein [Deferribacteraceae bacterium]